MRKITYFLPIICCLLIDNHICRGKLLHNMKPEKDNQTNNIDMLVELSKKTLSSCAPLEKLGIIEFRYGFNFNNLSQFSLGSHVPWVEDYYALDFHKMGSFNQHPSRYESSIVLWSDVNDCRPFLYARDHFDIGKGLTIIEKCKKGCEFYFFGGAVDNPQITNFLVNNIPLLKRFISHFKSENKKIITQASDYCFPLYLPDDPKEIELNTNATCLFAESQSKIDEFLQATKPKQLYLNTNSREVVLTKAECNCIALLLQGKSAEQTAQLLFNSRRTIEKHLDHVREKLDCENKIQLITLLAKQCHIL